MDASGAFFQHIVPILLTLLCGLAAYIVHLQKHYMDQHHLDHTRLDNTAADHDQRLTRVETQVFHVENDIQLIRMEIKK